MSGVVRAAIAAVMLMLAPPALAIADDDETPTPYRDSWWGSSGLSDRQMSETSWRLRFKGNRWADEPLIADCIELKAAEIGREEGYSHFIIDEFRAYSELRTRGSRNACHSNGQSSVCTQGQLRLDIKNHGEAVVTYFNEPVDGAIVVTEAYERLAPLYLDPDD